MVHQLAQRLPAGTELWGSDSSVGSAQELCESGRSRPGLPVPNNPYGLCGRKATFNLNWSNRVQEVCESGGGRPGLPVPNSPYGLCGRKTTLNSNLVVHRAKRTCATPTRVRVPGAARAFSPRLNFQCRLSYGVRSAPVGNGTHQHLYAR